MGDEKVEIAIVVVVARGHAHTGLFLAIGTVAGTRGQGDIFEAPVAQVAQQQIGIGVVGHVQIQISIAIAIDKYGLEPVVRHRVNADLSGNILKGAVAPVAVERVLLSLIGVGALEYLDPLPQLIEVGFGEFVRIKADKIGHVQIHIPVHIVVAPGNARAPARIRHPCGLGDLGERAIAPIAVEPVGSVVGHQEVGVAVVVVVRGPAAHAPSRVAHASRARDLGERAIAPVAVEPVAGWGIGQGVEGGAID